MKNIVILASGTGTNAQNIINYFRHSAQIKVSLILSNNPKAGVLKIAQQENIPHYIIEKGKFFSSGFYIDLFHQYQINLIVLAGFLWKVPPRLVHAFPDKIINIHPALLPLYGGKGMYGQYVHEAVMKAREMQSGITIHYVNENYDEGNIIFQQSCDITEEDTPLSLAQKVHELEYEWYPKVIEELLNAPIP